MNSVRTLIMTSIVMLSSGCGDMLTHPLKLQFPTVDCTQAPQPCLGYVGCTALNINNIYIEVGPGHTARTDFLCTVSASAIMTDVYYYPGQDSYTINASYGPNDDRMNLPAGPFNENEAQTPWVLLINPFVASK